MNGLLSTLKESGELQINVCPQYKHDAQASVPENSLACAACLYADSCRSPKSLRDFDRLG